MSAMVNCHLIHYGSFEVISLLHSHRITEVIVNFSNYDIVLMIKIIGIHVIIKINIYILALMT